jgi:methionyl-tRNA synthetase
MSTRFYITTPIYYPNGEPHLGHVYTTVCADAVARFHRLIGDRTYFLTGTDEHGIKMVKSADAAGTTPDALATANSQVFRDAFAEFAISNDDFIRTTEPRHKDRVAEIVRRMIANDDIYLGHYEGWYDEGQEEFVTETEAKAAEYKSTVSGRALVRYREPTYFLRLLRYRDRILAAIETDALRISPPSRKAEILNAIRAWDSDLSISRASLKWGVPMPNDPGHVVYVWIDALSNYVTALDYPDPGAPHGGTGLFEAFWPADVHVIGREIIRPHAFYWPAMLLSLGLPLPRAIFAHGWWTADGRKMSKSMGNFIDLERLRAARATYSLDALRYYMLRAAPFGSDLDWSEPDFLKAFNELANVLGNCLNRTLKMLGKYRGGVIGSVRQPPGDLDAALIASIDALPQKLTDAYARLDLQQAALLPVELARQTNGYIDATQPFSLAKDPAREPELSTVLHLSAQAVRRALVGLLPILPDKAAEGLRQLGVDVRALTPETLWSHLPLGHKTGEGSPLFPRADSIRPNQT